MINDFKTSSELLLSMFDTLPIGVLLVDSEGDILFSNYKSETILGFDSDELIGLSVHSLVPVESQQQHIQLVANYISKPTTRSMDSGRLLSAIRKDGSETQVQIGLAPLIIEDVTYVLVSIIEAKNQVLKVASHNDSLTGLANRILFNELCETIRNVAIRNNDPITILFVDLDNFKQINDNFGHQVGDSVLRKVAEVLSSSIRKNDIIGRVGGDEFVICLYGIRDINIIKNMANKFIADIIKINYDVLQINQDSVLMGASIGILHAETPADLSIKDMIKKAVKLMYKAKQQGKGTVQMDSNS